MFENKERTEISQLGEFGLINHLAGFFENKQPSTIMGIGDDAAVIENGGNEYGLLTVDAMFEGVHFDLTFHPLKHLGFKAVATAVSDVCAMNGTPTQILISLGLSNRFSLEAVEELYDGIRVACDKYQVDLVGGDTTSSPRGLSLTVTVYGTVVKEKLSKRSGAKEHDLLVVTGDLGAAYMGLQMLEREKKVFMDHPNVQPDLEGHEYILGRQLRPDARLDIVQTLASLNIVPTSMIDISDGLASEIHHLGMHSACGFDVYDEKLPIDTQVMDRAMQFDLNPSVVALNGGEDYELLFTVGQEHYETLKSHPDFTIIGHTTANKGAYRLIGKSGAAFEMKAQGWQHFKG
jgi:thiamine-monophosphate kinase